jgi:hypothetical protein
MSFHGFLLPQSALDAGRITGFSACGSVEMTIFFGCFGGKAAKTTEINVFLYPAGGEKRRSQGCSRRNGLFRPFDRLRTGSGSKEKPFQFV